VAKQRRLSALGRLRERIAELDDDDESFYASLGAQVVEQRLARGLSQSELASLCGTSQPAIARLESGAQAPRVETLRRVANALDCELELRIRPRTLTKGAGDVEQG
jgi:transcriptional regulator with XRE-family HTH domain